MSTATLSKVYDAVARVAEQAAEHKARAHQIDRFGGHSTWWHAKAGRYAASAATLASFAETAARYPNFCADFDFVGGTECIGELFDH